MWFKGGAADTDEGVCRVWRPRWPCWTVSFVLNLPDHRVTFRSLLRCKSPFSLQIWVQRFFTAAHPTLPPPASFYNQARLGNTDPDEILATGDPVWAISSSSSTTKRIEVLKTWAPWERESGEVVEDPGASLRRHHVNGRSRDGEKRGSRSDHREYTVFSTPAIQLQPLKIKFSFMLIFFKLIIIILLFGHFIYTGQQAKHFHFFF